MAIQLIGNLVGAAENVVHLVGGDKAADQVAHAVGPLAQAGQQVVAVVTHTEGAAQAVKDLVGGLAGGSKADSLAALFPDLDTKHINALLTVADGISRALKNDGKVDYMEAFEILQSGLRAELS